MEGSSDKKEKRLATQARILKHGAEGDAAMERGGSPTYDFYDSPAEDFDRFFEDVIAPYPNIREYVDAWYGSEKGELIGVELGGPARKLFGDLNDDGLFRRTVGFVLHDPRSDADRAADLERRHDIVEADVFFKKGADGLSWKAVEEWTTDNGKPVIMIQRMVQGVDLIRNSELYMAIVKRWLSQLAEGGTLLTEIPKKMPLEQRQKLLTLLGELDADEVVPNSDLTSVLIRV